MRLPLRLIATCLIAGGLVAEEAVAPAPAASPEQAILAPVQALRHNDLLALFKAMPAEQQDDAQESWATEQKRAPSPDDAKVDQVIKLTALPNAVDVLMLQVEPQLKQLDPNQLAFQLQMGVGVLGMMLAQNPDGAAIAEALQGIATDLVAWLPKSGINDPQKARGFLTGVVAAARAFEVADASALRALSLDALIDRAGHALKEIKGAFAVYGCDLDAFLDSIKVTDVSGDGDKRSVTLRFAVLGKPRSLPLKLINKDGRWVGDESAVRPLVQSLSGQGQGQGQEPIGGPGAGDEGTMTPVELPPAQEAPAR